MKVDCCRNPQQIGNKVDFAADTVYFGADMVDLAGDMVDSAADTVDFGADAVDLAGDMVDFAADTVNFVASVYGSKATKLTFVDFQQSRPC